MNRGKHLTLLPTLIQTLLPRRHINRASRRTFYNGWNYKCGFAVRRMLRANPTSNAKLATCSWISTKWTERQKSNTIRAPVNQVPTEGLKRKSVGSASFFSSCRLWAMDMNSQMEVFSHLIPQGNSFLGFCQSDHARGLRSFAKCQIWSNVTCCHLQILCLLSFFFALFLCFLCFLCFGFLLRLTDLQLQWTCCQCQVPLKSMLHFLHCGWTWTKSCTVGTYWEVWTPKIKNVKIPATMGQ